MGEPSSRHRHVHQLHLHVCLQQIHVHKRRWTHEDLLLWQSSHRYRRGCCLQGSGQEQVVIYVFFSKENHLRNHQSSSSHVDGNHCNHHHCDVGDGERRHVCSNI